MSDLRVALYVYEKSTVTISPDGPVDFYRMVDDYSAEFVTAIAEPTALDLLPGVYGYAYRDKHGAAPDPTGRVTLVVDLQRKQPWPMPPPPPPPPYVGRRDWREHTTLFMAPIGFEVDAPAAPARND